MDLNQILDKLLVNWGRFTIYGRNSAIIINYMTPVYRLYNIDNSINQIDNLVDHTRVQGAFAVGMLVSELTTGNDRDEDGRRRKSHLGSLLTTMFALSATLHAGFQEQNLLNQRHELMTERNAVLNMANAPSPQI